MIPFPFSLYRCLVSVRSALPPWIVLCQAVVLLRSLLLRDVLHVVSGGELSQVSSSPAIMLTQTDKGELSEQQQLRPQTFPMSPALNQYSIRCLKEQYTMFSFTHPHVSNLHDFFSSQQDCFFENSR